MIITIEEARAFYANAESAHDFEHVLRVLTLAERLARAENADAEIVHAAALLHDIARLDEDTRGGDHAVMAAERAREILLQRGIPADRADAVAHAIAAHRFRGTVVPQTLEAKILFDADKLDSIGAIGVARAYAIAGALNQRVWGEVAPDAIATRDQHNSDHTPVAEFAVKLSKVRERLHTRTARAIADERHAYMTDFFARLEREVRGEL
ncbi:2-amino-1-hydroxyethylphosphonate dioxygenase (glycine-forming) [Anaerolineae bacterium]|nr:2-amino-1-hydroxyethylphosphonate dioxygenase (glycine-forming) [Anaerolineae bacterium]